jgi:energy-coupling factor transport system permease protein
MTPQLRTVERSTVFSRLDFRAKLAVFVAASVIALCWDDPRLSAGLALGVAAACVAVGVPRAYLGLMLRVMLPFFLLLLVTHGFFNVQHVLRLTGRAALTPVFTLPAGWWIVGGGSLSLEGLLYGVTAIGKSLTFLLLVPLCVFTTDPNRLVVGLVRLRLPYKLAFVIASTLRFFPLIFDEIRAVRETQRLRGHAIEELGALERVRAYGRLAVPVILGAMFKAQQIEVVLQAKAFSGEADRTYLHESELRRADLVTISLAAGALVAAVALRLATGFGRFTAGG